MEAGGALAPALLAAFSLPCVLLLLLALGKAGLRAAAALRGASGGHAHAWPTRPGGASAYHPPASVFRDDDGGEPPLPPECCDRLALAAYRRGRQQGRPDPECVFCLSAVGDGEEVRKLRCRHVFHRACLDAWLVRPRATCPLCRDTLLPADTPRSGPVRSADDATSYGFEFGVHGGGDLSSSSVHAHGGALWHMT